jgi:hypothetical protein
MPAPVNNDPIFMLSFHIRYDPLTNNINSGRVCQIVDTAFKELNIISSVSQYITITFLTEQSSDDTCLMAVVYRQSSFACAFGTPTDVAATPLPIPYFPILFR